MNSNKKVFVLAVFTSIVAVACTADTGRKQDEGKPDYAGLFEPITVDVTAANLHGNSALVDLQLPDGSSVTANLEVKNSAFKAGRVTVRLYREGLTAIGETGGPELIDETEIASILNNPSQQPVCDIYTVSAVGAVVGENGQQEMLIASLAASNSAFAEKKGAEIGGSAKGCQSLRDPGAGEKCDPNECTTGLSIGGVGFEYTGKCDGRMINLPGDLTWVADDSWIGGHFEVLWVPMLQCYCNTTK